MRKPVGVAKIPGHNFVICDDGACFSLNTWKDTEEWYGVWYQYPPVPGTEHALYVATHPIINEAPPSKTPDPDA